MKKMLFAAMVAVGLTAGAWGEPEYVCEKRDIPCGDRCAKHETSAREKRGGSWVCVCLYLAPVCPPPVRR